MRIDQSTLKYFGFNTQGDLGPWTCYTNKNRKLVVFPRSPPLNPPSVEQKAVRQMFIGAAQLWRSMTTEQRRWWKTTADNARLRITGYNLFTSWTRTNDNAGLATIARQAGTAGSPYNPT